MWHVKVCGGGRLHMHNIVFENDLQNENGFHFTVGMKNSPVSVL